MKTFTVNIQHNRYPIYIQDGVLREPFPLIERHTSARTIVVIVDTLVAKHYLKYFIRKRKGIQVYPLVIPRGEGQKNFDRYQACITRMLQWKIPRNSAVIALGGGVVGDLAGFVAATYLRGVDFIQIPTTLLAQVDSSVGGKVGINHTAGKNLVGTFYQPRCVIIDPEVLSTLSLREMVCGLGEVVKYGVIMDRAFFEYCEKNIAALLRQSSDALHHIIGKSCQLKGRIVAKDEKESGIRAILNFGHTVGHALERHFHYKGLKHGEAVLYGMAAEAFISHRMNVLSESDFHRLSRFIDSFPLPPISRTLPSYSLISTMRSDKKSTQEAIRMSLISRIGKAMEPIPVSETHIAESLGYLYRTFRVQKHS